MKKIQLILALFFLGNSAVWAGSQSGADFLKIPVGARALSMGQAYSAMAEGVDALNWNAAGIYPSLGEAYHPLNLSVSHQELFFDNKLDYLALTRNYDAFSLGFSALRLSYPNQEERNVNREQVGTFGANDLSLGLGLAASVGELRIGTQVKLIRQQLASETATGAAFDFGIMSQIPDSAFRIGASVRNLGPSMKFVQESYGLPLSISLGTAYQIVAPLTLALELSTLPRQHQTNLCVGSEFMAAKNIALRAGYLAKLASAVSNNQTQQTNNGDFGSVSGINAGIGFKFSGLSLDYSLSPFGELGDIQTLTLSTSFGGSSEHVKVTQPAPEKLDREAPSEKDRRIIVPDKPIGDQDWWGK